LARDPLGIKPLYYAQTAEGFAFAQKFARFSLLARCPTPVTGRRHRYLLFGSVPEPVTLLEGVFSLPPGHRMLLHVPERLASRACVMTGIGETLSPLSLPKIPA